MSLRFKGADLRPVLTEAIANQGRLRKRKKSYARAEVGPLAAMQSCDQRAETLPWCALHSLTSVDRASSIRVRSAMRARTSASR